MVGRRNVAIATQTAFNVGGILLHQPFKIRRLGHFGFNLQRFDEGVRFYTEDLGFRVSDVMEFQKIFPQPGVLDGVPHTRAFFTRYGSDHHALVLFPTALQAALARYRNRDFPAGITVNQITWQVGTLGEVGRAIRWFGELGIPIQRSGRDFPGSNWHTYVYDPDGHTNELYYGIEQIGWDGHSKPLPLYERLFDEPPPLPQPSEQDEVQQALAQGVDLLGGQRHPDPLPAAYDVDGVLLPRPFKITRIGPVRLFVRDVSAAEAFYRDRLGFVRTEETVWQGERYVFLRCNTEHHALALYPLGLRERLGLSPHSTVMALGLQVGSYQQLRDARDYLRGRGVPVVETIPPALYPGIDYALQVQDPDGHCLQLYYQMEQIGWDGQPRPAELRRRVEPGVWPEALEPLSDTYHGEPFLGPLG
jgi:catechol 2,3-dioxygenase-like lactoylglutathione lyase family enzyme